MFGFNLVPRIYLSKSSRGDRRLILIYRRYLQPKQSRASRFSTFRCKALKYKLFKQLPVNWLHNSRKCFTYGCQTVQESFVIKSENDMQATTCFQKLMHTRKEQAHQSVLLHIPTKDDIPYALAKCEQFGSVISAYSYSGEMNNHFVLTEFSNETAIQDLFKSCQHQRTSDIFPVFSRILQFEKKSRTNLPKVNIEIQEDSKSESFPKIGRSISEVIEDIYSNEKLTELDTRLRYFYCELVKDAASGVFPYCDVFPFGSSVNGIGRRGCDLDAMLRLYPDSDALIKLDQEAMNNDGEFTFLNKTCIGEKSMQQKVINFLGDYCQSFLPGITSVKKILHARVPILKMNHRLLKMDCDVSVNNMSAIFMSDIVYFCGEVDPRFRPLLYAVKKWAREAAITHDKPGSWITNFGLTSLLIYFFQKEQILPPLINALIIIGEDNSPYFHLQYLKSIEEWKKLASENKKSLAELLRDFLSLLSDYPFDENILSLMSGKPRHRSKTGVTLWVQYPFDEDLNVTKNVSDYEFSDLRYKAGITAKTLENRLNQKSNFKDFSLLLGIPHFKKPRQAVNVNSYFKNNNFKHRPTKLRRA